MSFSMVAAGHKEHVRRSLNALVDQHKSWSSYDTSQEEKVLELIEHHLDSHDYAGGVIVEASGHHDQTAGSLDLKIRPVHLPAGVNEPAAPHEHAPDAE